MQWMTFKCKCSPIYATTTFAWSYGNGIYPNKTWKFETIGSEGCVAAQEAMIVHSINAWLELKV